MAAIPHYVYERKKILKQYLNSKKSSSEAIKIFEEKFFLEEKIEYILINQPSKIHHSRKFKTDIENDLLEKCIKDLSDYNMIDSNEDFITYYYLVKTETYLENLNLCEGL